jgi:hypothetical protein
MIGRYLCAMIFKIESTGPKPRVFRLGMPYVVSIREYEFEPV